MSAVGCCFLVSWWSWCCLMQVWLPLQPKEDKSKNKGFLSKRIMLPFAVDIYPLGMLSPLLQCCFYSIALITAVATWHKRSSLCHFLFLKFDTFCIVLIILVFLQAVCKDVWCILGPCLEVISLINMSARVIVMSRVWYVLWSFQYNQPEVNKIDNLVWVWCKVFHDIYSLIISDCNLKKWLELHHIRHNCHHYNNFGFFTNSV